MAIQLDSFAFTREPRKRGKYPWTEWLDGSIRLLVRGEDYTSETAGFRRNAYLKATERDLKLRTAILQPGDVIDLGNGIQEMEAEGIVIQAFE